MFRGFGAFGLFVALAPACVSTRMYEEGAGGGGSIYSGDRDAGADADASSTTAVKGMTPVTAELRNQLEASACASWSSDGETQPTLMTFVVDVSSSMSDKTPSTGGYTKWEITRDSLQSTVNMLPQATALGLLFFPNRTTVPNQNTTPIDVSNCLNTAGMITVAPLGSTGSSQRQAVMTGLKAVTPQGGTPTLDAYTYALNSGWVSAMTASTRASMVLVTDSEPTIAGGCEGSGDTAVDYHPIIQAISDAWTNYGIRTYVIGSPGSEKNSATGADVRGWLSAAATAGQTPSTSNCSDTGVPNFCHFDLSQVSDFSASFQQALSEITGQILPCQYSIPSSPAGSQLDSAAINVLYAVKGDQTKELLIGQTDASCSSGNGWYLDASDKIALCPSTCKTIQQDPFAILRVLGGCQSITLIN